MPFTSLFTSSLTGTFPITPPATWVDTGLSVSGFVDPTLETYVFSATVRAFAYTAGGNIGTVTAKLVTSSVEEGIADVPDSVVQVLFVPDSEASYQATATISVPVVNTTIQADTSLHLYVYANYGPYAEVGLYSDGNGLTTLSVEAVTLKQPPPPPPPA